MMQITPITQINDKKQLAILDTSSISFMQELHEKNIPSDSILKDYDLILIPEWVLTEINDTKSRLDYIKALIESGYPIHSIAEGTYSDLANNEEYNLYQIVLASTYQIGRIKSYLRRFVEKADSLDMDEYKNWINKLYSEWPIPGELLSSGRIKKKNAGEVSITILTEVVSWYYPETETLTIYSQDSDTYEFQRKAEANLRNIFASKIPVPISYKSNDAILCQLFREGKINLDRVKDSRKDIRKITYSKKQADHSIILVTEIIDNDSFVQLIQDSTVHIIF